MIKDDLLYVGHMLDTARKAVRRVAGKTRADFDADEDLRIVLTHLIRTIGEGGTPGFAGDACSPSRGPLERHRRHAPQDRA